VGAGRRSSGSTYLSGRGLVGPEGEVADDERPRRAAHDGAAVLEHEVERDGEGVAVPVRDHRGGVADEDEVDPRGVHVDRGRVVVRGDHGEGLPAAVLPAERRQRHAPRRRRRLLLRPGRAAAPVDGGRLRSVAQQPPRSRLPEGLQRPHLGRAGDPRVPVCRLVRERLESDVLHGARLAGN
jgi:hypothetical protein